MEFERYWVTSNDIPGMVEYRDVLNACKEFWNKSGSEKTESFLNSAILSANKKKGYVLRISDYNTKGLSDPYNKDEDFSFDGWNALLKIDGGANKGDDKAGAFGIGKSAPFSNSFYRLVFYRTLNIDGEKAAQGVSRIVTFKDNAGNLTTGIGYYGDSLDNSPVECIPQLDELSKRDEPGTDVFVYGFKGSDEWMNDIMAAILDSFLISIYSGKLIVNLKEDYGKREISKETLATYMPWIHSQKKTNTKSAYGNYLALTRNDECVHIYTKEFHGMGTLELRILVDAEEKLDRKVLIVRKAGMKLFRLGNISKLVPFTGILELKGKELNRFFREMETVAHDNWEPGRHHDPKMARAYYDEIKEWIRGLVADLAEHSSSDEMEVEGLGGVLQKDTGFFTDDESENKIESLNDYLGEINVLQPDSVEKAKGFFYGQGIEGRNNIRKTAGTLGKDGDSGLRVLKGKRKRKTKVSHKGRPDPNGKDIVFERLQGGETHCPLKNVRIIKRGTGCYSVNFEIPKDIDKGTVELVAVGENGKSNSIRIKDARVEAGCSSLNMNGGVIETAGMMSSSKVRIQVELYDAHDYAMEVNVYEHK